MSEYYNITKLQDDEYRINSPENVYMELLVGSERAMLIDTGYGFGPLKETVRELIGDKPLYIVNTHGHVDHTCGNFQFEEEVFISEKDMDLMHRHNDPEFRSRSAKLAEHVTDWVTGEEKYGLPDPFDPEWYRRGSCGNYRPLEEGRVFDLGGKTLRAVSTPGHTKGCMSFFYEEKNRLYAGDAANLFLWLFDQDATDRETYIRTLDKIQAIAPELIYGGHSDRPFNMEDLQMFKRAAIEADYDKGIPFSTPIMPDSKDIRVCILDGKTMADIGKPGFYAILLDSSRR